MPSACRAIFWSSGLPQIHFTTRDGQQSKLEADAPITLMELLRDANAGVEGICGGECSCGTCHVYVEVGGEQFRPKSEDEQAMLEAIGEFVEIRPSSRLSCQLLVEAGAPDITVVVGPVA
jgi:2Fe-2S ferredoxin